MAAGMRFGYDPLVLLAAGAAAENLKLFFRDEDITCWTLMPGAVLDTQNNGFAASWNRNVLGTRQFALVALLIASLMPAAAHAQGCCTPGTSPLRGLIGSALELWRFESGLASEGYELRKAYRGSEPGDDPAGRHSRVARVLGWVRLGLPAAAVFAARPARV